MREADTLPVAPRVRSVLDAALDAGDGVLTLERTAARLHMSERSLRRGLRAEGTSFSRLADASAADVACRLLREGRTVESVAETIGYSSASAFTHAFKRWTGTTPGRYANPTELIS
jgi:AraC-like DNA-binding protein